MNRRDLFLRLRSLVARRRVDRELDEELSFHIERETQQHIANGSSPADARARAVARFGPVPLAADRCRDARGTGLIDDLVRDIAYALRSFRRTPLAALTIVSTVALGLGLVTAVFAIYSSFLLRTDAVRNPDELFAVAREEQAGSGRERDVGFTSGEYDSLRRETSVFTDAVMLQDFASMVPINGRPMRAALVSGNFFQVLGAQPALGRPLLPDDATQGASRPVIVLSDAGWRKLFQRDRTAIGQSVVIKGTPHVVVGIMPEGFRGLGVTPPDYWAPLSNAEDRGEIIGRLHPAVSREAATAAIAGWASARAKLDGSAEKAVTVWLTPRRGTLRADEPELKLLFIPLFFAFGLILMIGCANVANLLLARGLSRQREIGVRLSLGASRRRIVRQLLTESLLLALVAAAGALIVSRLILHGLLSAVMTTIPPDFVSLASMLNLAAPAADWRLMLFLSAGAIASTALFGLAPALQATRLDLVRTMRGEVTRDAHPRHARVGLIAIQVGASALLLVCATIFLRGAVTAAAQGPGIRTSDTLRVSFDDETQRTANLETIGRHPLVAMVAAASPAAPGMLDTPGSGRIAVGRVAVSPEYFTVAGFELVTGRSFAPDERTAAAGVVVVSESIARQISPNGDSVGQVVRLDTPEPRLMTVIGIVRNRERVSSLVYLPTRPESPGTQLLVRVRGNPDQARIALLERLAGLDPAFGVMTLRSLTRMQAYPLQLAFAVTVVLAALALVLTVSGLFSVLSYLIEQQAREIGVRVALGAATRHITQLVLSQSLRPVVVGLAGGGGLALITAIVLMHSPLAVEIDDSIDVLDPVAYVASALVISLACVIAVSLPTRRAARLNPIETLRSD